MDLEDIDAICREIEKEEQEKESRNLKKHEKKRKKDERGEMSGEIQRQSDVWTAKMTEVLCQHLNRFGACIIDNFLGKEEAQVDLLTLNSWS